MSMIDPDILELYQNLEADAFASAEVILENIANCTPELCHLEHRQIDNKWRMFDVPSKHVKSLQVSFVRALYASNPPKFSKYSTGGIPKKSREDAMRLIKKPFEKAPSMSLSWI